MYIVLACAFPALLLLALMALLPVRVPERRPGFELPPAPNTTPLTSWEYFAQASRFLVTSFGLTVPIALAQLRLFELASASTASDFSYRSSDMFAYALLPAFFGGMLVAVVLLHRFNLWYHGDGIFELLDRPGPDGRSLSMRQEIRSFPYFAAGFALLATAANAAAFDTYIRVADGTFSHSAFFSARSYERPIGEIAGLVVHEWRTTPNGTARRPHLEVQFTDGTSFDTFSLIEPVQIPPLVAAIQDGAASPIPVRGSVDLESLVELHPCD